MNYLSYYLQAIKHPLPEMIKTFEYEQIYLSYKIGEAIERVGQTGILEVGCGCRPLPALAEILTNARFIGIDNNQDILNKVRITDFFGRPLANLQLKIEDARQLSFSSNEEFALAFSTYNLLGSGQSCESREKIISEQYRVTRPSGSIVNIIWQQNGGTTKFLKKYYKRIGAKIKDINMNRTILDFGDIERPSVSSIIDVYKRVGIKCINATELGPFWIAVSGVKSNPAKGLFV